MGVIVLSVHRSFWLALVLATLIIACRRADAGRTLRPLIGRDPLTTILATFGMSLILQKLRFVAVRSVARKINEPYTGRSISSIWSTVVPADDRGPLSRHHRRFYMFLNSASNGIWIRATIAGSRHGAGRYGHSGAMGLHRPRSRSAPGWLRRARTVRAAGRRPSHHGPPTGG